MGWGLFTINSKKIVSIIALLLFCICAFSQESVSSLDESSYVFNSASQSESVDQENTTSTFGLFMRMIFVLIGIIALIYAFVWALRKFSTPKAKEDLYLKEVANLTLSPGKSVRVISLKDKAYIIGVTDSSINLITEVQDKELIDAMNLNAEQSANEKPKDFSTMLSMFSGTSSNAESFLRQRREKFSATEMDK